MAARPLVGGIRRRGATLRTKKNPCRLAAAGVQTAGPWIHPAEETTFNVRRMPQAGGAPLEKSQARRVKRDHSRDVYFFTTPCGMARCNPWLLERGGAGGRQVRRIRPMPDDELTALVRAIAWELIQLGYLPAEQPGYVKHGAREPVRIVAIETWQAMKDIVAGAQP